MSAFHFVPAGDGHWAMIGGGRADRFLSLMQDRAAAAEEIDQLDTLAAEHRAEAEEALREYKKHMIVAAIAERHADAIEEEEEFYGEEQDGGDDNGDLGYHVPAFTDCYVEPSEQYPAAFGGAAAAAKGKKVKRNKKLERQLEEQYLTPQEREILRRKRNVATGVQVGATAGGALLGTLLGGPLGGAIGGAGGSIVGETLAPTPGEPYTAGTVARKAIWGAIAGGVSPLIFTGIAPLAAAVGGGVSGFFNSR